MINKVVGFVEGFAVATGLLAACFTGVWITIDSYENHRINVKKAA